MKQDWAFSLYHHHACAVLSSLVCFSLWNISFCTTVCLHKKKHILQPIAEYHNKIILRKCSFFLVAETLRNCTNLSVIALSVILNKTSCLKTLSINNSKSYNPSLLRICEVHQNSKQVSKKQNHFHRKSMCKQGFLM